MHKGGHDEHRHRQLADSPTRAPAIRHRDAADHPDRDHKPELSRIWVLLAALADAGAFIDPTGVLAAQRFARIPDQERVAADESSTRPRS
jgi:hypothetical protein